VDRKELAGEAKINANALTSIFQAMGWVDPEDGDYTPYLHQVLEIKEFKENRGAKSWVEAATLYRSPGLRKKIETIQETTGIDSEKFELILSESGISLEKLTDADINLFDAICQRIQLGEEIGEAVDAVKGAQNEAHEASTAIEVSSGQALMVTLPEVTMDSLTTAADALADEVISDVPGVMVEEALNLSEHLKQASREALVTAVFEKGINLNPQTIIAEYNRRRDGHGAT
jgi:hypothetical protein